MFLIKIILKYIYLVIFLWFINRRISKDRELAGIVRLSDWMEKPLILEMNNTFNELVRGLTVQEMSDSDQYYTDELTEYLFK